jgi:PAS domain S-box-containing protein
MATAEPDFLRISYSVTRVLANAGEPRQSIASILTMLSRSLHWDLGVMWIVDDRSFVLRCTACSPSAKFPMFERVCAGREFSMGEGLPGATWQEHRCVWMPDLRSSDAERFPRLSVAVQEGISSGAAFPLYVTDGVLGVIEMFSRKRRASDPRVQEFWQALGGQIGVFLEHARTRSELKELDSQLKLLAESASEAIFTLDENGAILTANAALEKMFGYGPAELIGKKITLLMPQVPAVWHAPRNRSDGQKERSNASGEGTILDGFHKDGHCLRLRVSFAEFRRGGKRVFTGFAALQDAKQHGTGEGRAQPGPGAQRAGRG